MTFLAEIQCCGHTCRATADHSHLLAGGCADLGILLPDLLIVMLYGISLQIADRNRIVQAVALAYALALMHTNHTKCMRERNLLADNGNCLRVLALFDEANVFRNIHMRGALCRAGL